MKRRKRLTGLPFYGGKGRMSSKIVRELPPHTVYCEPFVGGASVMFKKGLPPITNSDHYREVINDKDERLINLYRQLRDNPRLCELLKLTPYSRADFNRAKEIYETSTDELELAWSNYVLICMAFSCITGSAFKYSIVTRNDAKVWSSRIEQIEGFIERLQGVFIEKGDYREIIERWDSPQTLFYCDPPYPGSSQGYKHKFDILDYQELCDCLDSIKGSFVLSCYAQGIEPRYWKKLTFEAYCSANNVGRTGKTRNVYKKQTKENLGNTDRKESLFIVDRSTNTREDLHQYLWSPSKGFQYRQCKIDEARLIRKTEELERIFGGCDD